MRACVCGTEFTLKRVAAGWKEHAGRLWCPKCWKTRFRISAPTIRVIRPLGMEWKDLRPLLLHAQQACAAISNVVIRELAKAEPSVAPGDKIPKQPKEYVRPAAQVVAGDVSGAVLDAVVQRTHAAYRASRFDVLRGAKSWPSFRFPQPVPVKVGGWRVDIDESDGLVLSAKVLSSHDRLRFALAGGPEWRRQRRLVEQFVSGDARYGELAFVEQSHNGRSVLMAKMVGYFPRQEMPDRSGAFVVTTATDSLIVALDVKGSRLWTIHGDHVRRWSAEHSTQLQRWSDDAKMEMRRRGETRRVPWHERREAAAEKFNRRMNTACAQIAAQIVGYADRRRFAEVIWSPSEARFVESFRWHRLATEIQQRCDAIGIQFTERKLQEVSA